MILGYRKAMPITESERNIRGLCLAWYSADERRVDGIPLDQVDQYLGTMPTP